MKKIYKYISWLLLIIQCAWLSRIFIPIALYGLNYKSIIANYCENKSTPSLGCNGKCYLKKKIAETEKSKTSQQTILLKLGSISTLFLGKDFDFSPISLPFLYSLTYYSYSSALSFISSQLASPPPKS